MLVTAPGIGDNVETTASSGGYDVSADEASGMSLQADAITELAWDFTESVLSNAAYDLAKAAFQYAYENGPYGPTGYATNPDQQAAQRAADAGGR